MALQNYQEVILELIELYKDKEWMMEVKIAGDDGGKTIDIIVDSCKYPGNQNIPLRYKGYDICTVIKPRMPCPNKV